ncbi:MAG: rRNA maturation RNase YbeY [bacterium]|nr:rRNA maturation RNase YbeY [bacterium]
MEDTISIVNNTKGKLPSLPFVFIKNDILSKNYVLSVAFVSEKVSKEINFKYRNKNKPTNILSFSLSKKEGEIILCPSVIKKESKNKNKNFGKNFKNLLGFLVIHGMLHLKGMEHSAIMEKAETKYDQKYFSGHRRGVLNDASRGRRIRKGRKLS